MPEKRVDAHIGISDARAMVAEREPQAVGHIGVMAVDDVNEPTAENDKDTVLAWYRAVIVGPRLRRLLDAQDLQPLSTHAEARS